MQRMAFFFILFSVFCSCQPLDIEETEAGTIPQIGDEAWESRALTSDEIQLARKFCRALESKEIAYRRDYIGQELNFNLQYRNCQGQTEASTVKARLVENVVDRHLEFIPAFTPIPFWREVQTIGGQVMGDFCIDLLSNLQVSNTILEGKRKSIFKFSSEKSNFRVQVQRLSQDSDEVNTLEELTIVGLGTGATPQGMVIDRVFLQACDESSDSSNSYYRRQSL